MTHNRPKRSKITRDSYPIAGRPTLSAAPPGLPLPEAGTGTISGWFGRCKDLFVHDQSQWVDPQTRESDDFIGVARAAIRSREILRVANH